MPGDEPTPIVTDDVDGVSGHLRGERERVEDQFVDPVLAGARRTGPRRVSARVRGEGAIAGIAKASGHGAPGLDAAGNPMEKDHDITSDRAAVPNVRKSCCRA
jgi:hypothetical protein